MGEHQHDTDLVVMPTAEELDALEAQAAEAASREVPNPAAELTAELIACLREAIFVAKRLNDSIERQSVSSVTRLVTVFDEYCGECLFERGVDRATDTVCPRHIVKSWPDVRR